MAMTMAENVIRKACDRCHTQKLSCKRVGDEPCERCMRLKTDCKSSPSLRYKKQQQQQQHHQQQQHQHQLQQYHHQPPTPHQHQHHLHLHQAQHQSQHQPAQPLVPGAETVQIRSRSPKRRRTDSDPSPVLPEAVPIVPQTEGLAGKAHAPVTPETVLDISDFNFDFGQLGFFPGGPSDEHLSHSSIPNRVEDFHPHQGFFADSWEQNHQHQQPHPLHQQQLSSSSSGFPVVTPNQLPQADLNSSPSVIPSVPLRRRSGLSEHGVSDKRIRNRGSKNRPRQIALRQSALRAQHLDPEVTSVHWMAQLNEINTRLLDLASALPSQQDIARGGPPLHRPHDERFKANGFPVDEMFQLTRRVAEILSHFSIAELGKDASKARHGLLDGSDPANSMLVLSTYVRLLDMYQRVFTLVSTELAQADSDAAFRFWKLPDVSVGSFAVESSPSLQMSLTIQLAEEFLGRLRSSTAALDSSTMRNGNGGHANGSNGRSMFSGVVDVSYQAVRSREEGLAKHLAQLRAEIEALLES